MTETKSAPTTPGDEERRELETAERKASEQQPKSFDDRAMDEKIVEVDKIGPDDSAIRGLDPN